MQFDWTTFVLEIINFLVLVWLLARFFYRPVLRILDDRKSRMEAEMALARQTQQDAETLKQQYAAQLADWHQEQEKARQQLELALARQKEQGLQAIQHQISDEMAKMQAREAAQAASRTAQLQQQAQDTAFDMAAVLLQRLGSAPLTARIFQLFLEDLAGLAPEETSALRDAARATPENTILRAEVAHALEPGQEEALAQALSALSGRSLRVACTMNPELIAGLRMAIGGYVLHANLADALEFFKHRNPHEPS